MSNIRDFIGKVVIITGSSSGIGAGIALQFSEAGAQVVVCGLEEDKCSDVAKQCKKLSPNGLEPLVDVIDVTKEDDCKRIIESTIKAFGKLDILINNAGIGLLCTIDDRNILNNFDKIINTNLRSIVYLSHLSVDHLEKTKGNIINISSVCSRKIFPKNFLYSVSKSGLDMFTKCLALELAPKGIRVNSVNPHAIKTNIGITTLGITQQQSDEMFENMKGSMPLGRYGLPQDIANIVLFLTNEQESSFVTGINLFADGGDGY